MAKLNVDLPDDLLRDLKMEAAAQTRTLRDLVIQALEARPKTVRVSIHAVPSQRRKEEGSDGSQRG